MSKRRRTENLQHVLHCGSISMAGLAKLLRTLEQEEHRTSAERMRAVLKGANHAFMAGMVCERELESTSGPPVDLVFADPGKLLASLVEESPALQDVYAEAWARSPSSPDRPWSMVVGFDEFTPGNKLSCDHARKTMVLSFSFLELGFVHLSRGASWCTPLVVRSTKIAKVHTETDAQ